LAFIVIHHFPAFYLGKLQGEAKREKMSMINFLVNKRIKVRKWLTISMLLSFGTTLLTYYALTILNSINGMPIFYEVIPIQAWLMAKLGMEKWLLLRIMIYSISLLFIIKYPMKLYERSDLFRYCTNIWVGLFAFGIAINFINDFMTICVIQ
jgi:hypothetical protein